MELISSFKVDMDTAKDWLNDLEVVIDSIKCKDNPVMLYGVMGDGAYSGYADVTIDIDGMLGFIMEDIVVEVDSLGEVEFYVYYEYGEMLLRCYELDMVELNKICGDESEAYKEFLYDVGYSSSMPELDKFSRVLKYNDGSYYFERR